MGSTADGVPILPLRDLPREAKARNLQLAIVAVPAESAQPVTETLVAAGIKAILNFAPGRLRAPKDVRFKSVDLSIELETLSFYLVQRPRA
jgi:redox-sensing transcriptional repressor